MSGGNDYASTKTTGVAGGWGKEVTVGSLLERCDGGEGVRGDCDCGEVESEGGRWVSEGGGEGSRETE